MVLTCRWRVAAFPQELPGPGTDLLRLAGAEGDVQRSRLPGFAALRHSSSSAVRRTTLLFRVFGLPSCPNPGIPWISSLAGPAHTISGFWYMRTPFSTTTEAAAPGGDAEMWRCRPTCI